jgi:predicted nucleotidyltransferase
MITKNIILNKLKQDKSYLQDNYSVNKIGLFGSYAKDNQTESSDIDFYVEFKNKSFDNLAGLWVYLEALYNKKIDIFYKHNNNNKVIIANIQKEVIYG